MVTTLLLVQGVERVEVGRVTAVYWPGDGAIATSYAEIADAARTWPGLSEPSDFPIRLIVVPDQERFDSVTRGRVPEWGVGAAIPSRNMIVVRRDFDGGQVLRHELAHLALRNRARVVPRWFDEGYASFASGEWGRLDGLQVNLALLAGRPPTLPAVNRGLLAGRANASQSYGFATTAVLYLDRLGGERGLQPLLDNLRDELDFDAALRQTYGISLGQFEELWQRDLRRRYGWLSFFTSFTVFWFVLLLAVGAVWYRRRKRDRLRREALDEGWVIPSDFPPET